MHPSLRHFARLSVRASRVALASLPLVACAHGEPPTPGGSPSIALPELAVPSANEATNNPPDASPPLLAPEANVDPGLLPQTRDAPRAAGSVYDAHVSALWEAIVRDDPKRAMPFFFPRTAYEQVKDVAVPGADWSHRLVDAYARDIHALHMRLAENAASARLVGLDVPGRGARWVEPGEEYNKIGYFRVFGSKLRYHVDDVSHSFDVKSLISWRGEWYVVHLSAIK